MELTLIRHGRSTADDEERVEGGGWDAVLTRAGVRQAHLLADRLVAEGYDCAALYSSPLRRAAEVAAIVSEAIGVFPIALDDRLAELHLGRLSGLPINEAQARYPVPPGGVRSYTRFPDGEAHFDHVARVLGFCAEIRERHAADRVCVIAHGGTLSLMLQIIYGLPLWSPYLERERYRFRTADTGMHRLTIEGMSVVTHFLNDIQHLR